MNNLKLTSFRILKQSQLFKLGTVNFGHYYQQKHSRNLENKPLNLYYCIQPQKKEKLGLQELMKQYGPVAAGIHFVSGLTVWAMIYSALKAGVDIQGFIDTYLWTSEAAEDTSSVAGTSTTLALSYGIYKITSPLRIIFTCAVTPTTANLIKKKIEPKIEDEKSKNKEHEV